METDSKSVVYFRSGGKINFLAKYKTENKLVLWESQTFITFDEKYFSIVSTPLLSHIFTSRSNLALNMKCLILSVAGSKSA